MEVNWSEYTLGFTSSCIFWVHVKGIHRVLHVPTGGDLMVITTNGYINSNRKIIKLFSFYLQIILKVSFFSFISLSLFTCCLFLYVSFCFSLSCSLWKQPKPCLATLGHEGLKPTPIYRMDYRHACAHTRTHTQEAKRYLPHLLTGWDRHRIRDRGQTAKKREGKEITEINTERDRESEMSVKGSGSGGRFRFTVPE